MGIESKEEKPQELDVALLVTNIEGALNTVTESHEKLNVEQVERLRTIRDELVNLVADIDLDNAN